MNMMIEPNLLQPGDTVAVTAASGICDRGKLAAGVEVLKNLGLNVQVMESCNARHDNYLAGDVQLRLQNLHDAFADTNVKGIFMARGGYGAAQLLPFINFSMVAKNPKIFVGFSDVTALHIAFGKFCGFVTFHGPMVASCFGGLDAVSLESLRNAVFANENFSFGKVETLFPGHVRGRLVGGNLTVIASLLGTAYEIETAGHVLFLEDIGEEPYRVDRLLLQLKLAGKLRDAAGFVFGDFSPCTLDELRTALDEYILPLKKPTIWGAQCGHCKPNLTLPLGRKLENI